MEAISWHDIMVEVQIEWLQGWRKTYRPKYGLKSMWPFFALSHHDPSGQLAFQRNPNNRNNTSIYRELIDSTSSVNNWSEKHE